MILTEKRSYSTVILNYSCSITLLQSWGLQLSCAYIYEYHLASPPAQGSTTPVSLAENSQRNHSHHTRPVLRFFQVLKRIFCEFAAFPVSAIAPAHSGSSVTACLRPNTLKNYKHRKNDDELQHLNRNNRCQLFYSIEEELIFCGKK